MSVLIKNMEMPKGCIYANDNDQTEYCPLLNHDDVPFCQYIESEPEIAIGIVERPVYCPLSDVPEPCQDTIYRQDAIDAFGLSEKTRKYGGDHSGYDTRMLYEIQDVLEGLPSAQLVDKDINVPVKDCISRQAAIDAIKGRFSMPVDNLIVEVIGALPSAQPYTEDELQKMQDLEQAQFDKVYEIGKQAAQPEPQWIPFKTRPLTEEEQDEHPEWDCILDCKLPDDGQAILVSINLRGHERVQYDEFYTDDGSYLDSGYAIGAEATAWMPLPEPWRGEES